MDHDQATQIQASARYVVGDLTPSEVEAFEEHFFACPICAEEMKMEAIFSENLRAVFRDQARAAAANAPLRPALVPPAKGPGRRWRTAFAVPIGAAACLLIMAGYQNLVTIPGLKTQLSAVTTGPAPFSFPLKLARGTSAVTIPPGTIVFEPYFDLPKYTLSAHYICAIESPSGTRILERTIASPPAGQPIRILLRRSDFPGGTYLVKVRGENSPELIATYMLSISN